MEKKKKYLNLEELYRKVSISYKIRKTIEFIGL